MTTYESETCRITFHHRPHGATDLYIYVKEHPELPPFHRSYAWHEHLLWQRDLTVLLSVTGATQGEAA